MKKIFIELKGFKFVATLVLVFKQIESADKTKYDHFYSHKSRNNYQWKWHWWCIWNNLYYNYIKHKESLRKLSGLIINSVIDNNISISKYKPSAGSSSIRLPKELDHPKRNWSIFKILMVINASNGV